MNNAKQGGCVRYMLHSREVRIEELMNGFDEDGKEKTNEKNNYERKREF